MAKIWIKLYTEALHDRKMRKLSRFDKSVFYDLLLLAGQEDNNGYLPELEDIALELDLKVTEAEKSVTALLKAGLLTEDDSGNLIVTNYQQRQNSNLTGAEKVARHRERLQKNNQCNPDVTETGYIEVTSVTEEKPGCKEKVTPELELELKKELELDKELKRESKRENAPSPEPPEKPKPQKHKHGSFSNVLLTDEELRKLRERFLDADTRIEDFSRKKAAKGYSYKSDYAAILSWADSDAKRDAEKRLQQQAQQPKRTYSAAEVLQMQKDGLL